MQIVDNLIIISLIILAFIAGMKIDARYHKNALQDQKDALERQYLRLRAKADADDPCKPYMAPRSYVQPLMNVGDYDGDGPLGKSFEKELKQKGVAKTSFRKSDLAK